MAIAPRISISGGRAAYVGPTLDLAPHCNAVATVAVGLEAAFQLTTRDGVAKHHIALIAPNTLHHLVGAGDMAFVYLDALGDDYRALMKIDLDMVAARLCCSARAGAGADALCAALSVSQRPAPDARIAHVLRRVEAAPQCFPRVADAAFFADLSTSRFQALFRRAVGMSFRRYRTWARLAFVVRSLSGETSLTQAALEAGFSSSAHLSADFKKMFGLAPSKLVALRPSLSMSGH